MNVVVNGDPRRLRDGSTVADLVRDLGRTPRGLAVAVDGELVPRSAWPTTELRDDERVEILAGRQGG